MGAMSVLAACSNGAEYHVDPGSGSHGDGSEERPFRTIAQATARLGAGDSCILHGGVYRETVVPARSGTAEHPVTFRAASRRQDAVIPSTGTSTTPTTDAPAAAPR